MDYQNLDMEDDNFKIVKSNPPLLSFLEKVANHPECTTLVQAKMMEAVRSYLKYQIDLTELHNQFISILGKANMLYQITNEYITAAEEHRAAYKNFEAILSDMKTIPPGPLFNIISNKEWKENLLAPSLSSTDTLIPKTNQPFQPLDTPSNAKQRNLGTYTANIESREEMETNPYKNWSSLASYAEIKNFPLGAEWGHQLLSSGKLLISVGGGSKTNSTFDCFCIMDMTSKFSHRYVPCTGNIPSPRDKFFSTLIRLPRTNPNSSLLSSQITKGGLFVYLFGGYCSATDSNMNDSYLLDIMNGHWIKLNSGSNNDATNVPLPRCGHSLLAYPRIEQHYQDFDYEELFDGDNSFSPPLSTNKLDENEFTRSVILFGGSTKKGLANDSWALDVSTWKWHRLSDGNILMPLPRECYTMSHLFEDGSASNSRKFVLFGGATTVKALVTEEENMKKKLFALFDIPTSSLSPKASSHGLSQTPSDHEEIAFPFQSHVKKHLADEMKTTVALSDMWEGEFILDDEKKVKNISWKYKVPRGANPSPRASHTCLSIPTSLSHHSKEGDSGASDEIHKDTLLVVIGGQTTDTVNDSERCLYAYSGEKRGGEDSLSYFLSSSLEPLFSTPISEDKWNNLSSSDKTFIHKNSSLQKVINGLYQWNTSRQVPVTPHLIPLNLPLLHPSESSIGQASAVNGSLFIYSSRFDMWLPLNPHNSSLASSLETCTAVSNFINNATHLSRSNALQVAENLAFEKNSVDSVEYLFRRASCGSFLAYHGSMKHGSVAGEKGDLSPVMVGKEWKVRSQSLSPTIVLQGGFSENKVLSSTVALSFDAATISSNIENLFSPVIDPLWNTTTPFESIKSIAKLRKRHLSLLDKGEGDRDENQDRRDEKEEGVMKAHKRRRVIESEFPYTLTKERQLEMAQYKNIKNNLVYHYTLPWVMANYLVSPFQAITLLLSNLFSPSSPPSSIHIHAISTAREKKCIIVENNTVGFSPPSLSSLLRSWASKDPLNEYPLSTEPFFYSSRLKMAFARLASTLLVITKTKEYVSVGLLSLELNLHSHSQNLASPIISFPLSEIHQREKFACLERTIAMYCPFSPLELIREIEQMINERGEVGTRYVLSDLRCDIDNIAFSKNTAYVSYPNTTSPFAPCNVYHTSCDLKNSLMVPPGSSMSWMASDYLTELSAYIPSEKELRSCLPDGGNSAEINDEDNEYGSKMEKSRKRNRATAFPITELDILRMTYDKVARKKDRKSWTVKNDVEQYTPYPFWKDSNMSIDNNLSTYLYWTYLFNDTNTIHLCNKNIFQLASPSPNSSLPAAPSLSAPTTLSSLSAPVACSATSLNSLPPTSPFHLLKSRLHRCLYKENFLGTPNNNNWILVGFLNDVFDDDFEEKDILCEMGTLLYHEGILVNRHRASIPQNHVYNTSMLSNVEEIRKFLDTFKKESYKDFLTEIDNLDVSSFPITCVIGMPDDYVVTLTGDRFIQQMDHSQWQDFSYRLEAFIKMYLLNCSDIQALEKFSRDESLSNIRISIN